jgi:hypothetical protein
VSRIFTAGPPGPPGPRDGAALWVRRLARRGYAGPAGLAGDAGHRDRLRVYLGDLLRPYGLTPRADVSRGHSYGEMADELLDAAAAAARDPAAADEPVDLLVLAYAIPDIAPGRATATYLSDRGTGAPLAFAVCDQGPAAAFTGLRLIQRYAATGAVERALLLVVEQADLPYDPGVPVDIPAGHSAVALWCATTPEATTRIGAVRQHTGISVAAAAAYLPGDAVLVLGDGLAAPPGARVRTAAAGRPYTGVWWELPDLLGGANGGGASGGPVVLAAYDRASRCLSTCRFAPVSATIAAAPGTASAPHPPPKREIPAAPGHR